MMKKLKNMDTYDLVTNIIVFIGAIAFLLPLVWLITNSFKHSAEIYQTPPTLIPERFTLRNFQNLFENQPALRWIFNSFFVSLVTGFFSVLLSSAAAYGFAKLDIKGKNVLFIVVIGSIMIPKETFIVPLFEIITALDWVDTYSGDIQTCHLALEHLHGIVHGSFLEVVFVHLND